ncbi:MAG: pseudoazurin [Paracoccus sp. (in: a-proteobacteria)]|uniref:pseudoazurin n=1 Tax=Paracoccus sp. TaxID=267 RepID=UPI0039E5F178
MKTLLLSAALTLTAASAHAANHEIKMLNFGEQGGMVFEPGFLKVAPGDTVTFQPTNSGHWVKGLIQPEGADPLESKLDQPYTVTLTQEGVYVYACPPHMMMSMVGVIQVGAASNIDQVREELPGHARRMFQNKGRLDGYLAQIKE